MAVHGAGSGDSLTFQLQEFRELPSRVTQAHAPSATFRPHFPDLSVDCIYYHLLIDLLIRSDPRQNAGGRPDEGSLPQTPSLL